MKKYIPILTAVLLLAAIAGAQTLSSHIVRSTVTVRYTVNEFYQTYSWTNMSGGGELSMISWAFTNSASHAPWAGVVRGSYTNEIATFVNADASYRYEANGAEVIGPGDVLLITAGGTSTGQVNWVIKGN